jgi:hypothetical protein
MDRSRVRWPAAVVGCRAGRPLHPRHARRHRRAAESGRRADVALVRHLDPQQPGSQLQPRALQPGIAAVDARGAPESRISRSEVRPAELRLRTRAQSRLGGVHRQRDPAVVLGEGLDRPVLAGELGRCLRPGLRQQPPARRRDHQAAQERGHRDRGRAPGPARRLRAGRDRSVLRLPVRLQLLDQAAARAPAFARARQPGIPAVASRVPQPARTAAAGGRSAREADVLAVDDGPDQQRRDEPLRARLHGRFRPRHQRHDDGQRAVAGAGPAPVGFRRSRGAPAERGRADLACRCHRARARQLRRHRYRAELQRPDRSDAQPQFAARLHRRCERRHVLPVLLHARSVLLPAARQGR